MPLSRQATLQFPEHSTSVVFVHADKDERIQKTMEEERHVTDDGDEMDVLENMDYNMWTI